MEGPDIDAEQIIMMARFWRLLGIQDLITLQINSLGDVESRVAYKNALTTYFEQYYDQLDEECQHRLKVNPLRILDSKNPDVNQLFKNAPVMSDYLDDVSQKHFNRLKELLDIAGVKYEINPRLVRGLDYYGMTIYEWVTESLGAQGTVCAGGRYDRLVEILGGKATSGIGFAMGLERIVTLIESVFTPGNDVDIYFILVGEIAETKGIAIAEKIRDDHPLLRVLVNCGGGSFKSQFKRADKLGAKIALVLGEDECVNNSNFRGIHYLVSY
jgi:histidyl-tRNA synthetase